MIRVITVLAAAVAAFFKVILDPDNGPRHRRAAWIEFKEWDPETGKYRRVEYMSEIREGQKKRLVAVPRTPRGNVAAIEPGSAVWSSTDESVVSVTPDPTNELAAEVEGLDGSNNESATIECRADGRRGEGVKLVVGTKAYTCTQGDATVFEFEETDVPEEVPGTPTEPGETPTEPEVPTEPETPTEPEVPTEPETPTEPGETPTEPLPENPDNQ